MENTSLSFLDWLKNFENLGKTEWVTVFLLNPMSDELGHITFFSALIPNNKVGDVLNTYQWDLRIDGGRPGFITHYKNGKSITKYYRFADDGIEPLVFWRTFTGKKESYYEVSEELRWYFNLFEKTVDSSRVYIFTNEDGEEDEVILIKDGEIQLKLKYLKEFLAVKQMHLAIYFELMRFTNQSLEELKQKATDDIQKGENYIYSLCVRGLNMGDRKTQGWLLGKKLVAGKKDFKPKIWPLDSENKFEEFITGTNEDGNEILASCNMDYQSSTILT